MSREELAVKAEMTLPELERIERGELDEWWGGIRLLAEALGMPVSALMIEAQKLAPGPDGSSYTARSNG